MGTGVDSVALPYRRGSAMARKPRRSSESGYLHLIVRGNNKQILFEEEEDYKFFISRLGRCCREASIRISAYCLMENHAHLLVNDPCGRVSRMTQNLATGYSLYYNGKYHRKGHLFQGRYLCEPVDNDLYLLTVFRYILNNPRKAGICPADQYRWSSYKAYFRESASLDLGFVRDRFPTEAAYRDYIGESNADECLEYCRPSLSDDQALAVLRKKYGTVSGSELQSWNRQRRDSILKNLKKEGLSLRQIERLTGISRSIAHRA